MRKSAFLLFVIVALLALPIGAQAQTEIVLSDLTIQLWPDHDQPAVLVIYDFSLMPETILPTTVHFQIPANGNLVAVAKSVGGDLLTVEASEATQGPTTTVTLTITDQTNYHIEYYMPYQQENATRDFVFTWPGDYAVKAFHLALQKPTAATNLTTDPVMSEVPADANGFAYLSTEVVSAAAHDTFSLHVRYDNVDNILSASTLTVQPSSPLTEDLPGQVSLTTYLPWALGVLAVVLIVGVLGWYWFSSRGETYPSRTKPRRAGRKTAEKAGNAATQVYCHQCGQRARPDDRFCRTCGTQLRQPEG
jgi:ribosomal protein L32